MTILKEHVPRLPIYLDTGIGSRKFHHCSIGQEDVAIIMPQADLPNNNFLTSGKYFEIFKPL